MSRLLITLLLCLSSIHAHGREDAGDYVYYKLHDLETRIEALESKSNEHYYCNTSPDDEIIIGEEMPKAAAPQDKPNKSSGEIRLENHMEKVLDPRVAEREFYDNAFSALRDNKTEEAEALFKDFIKKFPNSQLLSNVHYWLGEISLSQKLYKEASVHFLNSYQSKPKGSKAPDSVLKLALALENMGNRSGACATLIKLTQEFPNMHPDIRKQANIEIAKLRCDNS